MKVSDINYYNDDFLKFSVIASLCRDSLKMFQAVFRIKQVDLIRSHREKFLQAPSDFNEDLFHLSKKIYEELLIDDIKIISAFENFFKALLLESGFIFHETKQNKSPVQILPYPQNTAELKKTTYGISILLSSKFWKIFNLSNSDKIYISDIRDRRNAIHLLTSKPSYSPFSVLDEIEILAPLIRDRISIKYKDYCKKIDVKHSPELIDFSYLNNKT